jgi:hypothetical protein
MTDDLIRPVRGAFPGPAIEPNSGIRDQLALLGKVGVRYGGLGLASSLLDGLVAYWKLDETSGPRIDSAGSNNLTDNNTVGSAVGKVGNAASFVAANNEFLRVYTVAFSSSFTDEASINLWVKRDVDIPTSTSESGFLKGGNTTLEDMYYPFTDNVDYTGVFRNNRLTISPRLSGVPDRTVWHMLTITTTPGTNGYKIYQNGTLQYQNTGQSSVFLGPETVFGRSGNTAYYGGLFDEIGLWNRALTASEMLILYNSGAGITFPF